MKRFKTKQELDRKEPPGKIIPPYGEPYRDNRQWYIGAKYFTTNTHPYRGKEIKIQTKTPEESKKVQAKAFALGCGWNGASEHNEARRECPFLFICLHANYISFMGHGHQDYFDNHEATELTPQQFMEGYWPQEEPNRVSGTITFDEVKLDAYIDGVHRVHIYNPDTGMEVDTDPSEAWKYNLMSEAEFKEKHPVQLMFKQWGVRRNVGHIHVGCETLRTYDVQGFVNVTMVLNKHKVSKEDFYAFFYTHKNELGLDFSPCPTDD